MGRPGSAGGGDRAVPRVPTSVKPRPCSPPPARTLRCSRGVCPAVSGLSRGHPGELGQRPPADQGLRRADAVRSKCRAALCGLNCPPRMQMLPSSSPRARNVAASGDAASPRCDAALRLWRGLIPSARILTRRDEGRPQTRRGTPDLEARWAGSRVRGFGVCAEAASPQCSGSAG